VKKINFVFKSILVPVFLQYPCWRKLKAKTRMGNPETKVTFAYGHGYVPLVGNTFRSFPHS
jgi:hypothetical protein